MPYAPLRSLAGRAHTVIGAGTLGRRVAMMWLTNGQKVNLHDTYATTLKEAKKYIDTNLPSTIKKLVPTGRPGHLETFGDMKEALKGAWLVTEAIPEIKDAKIDLLGELDKQLGEDVIIATNSSSFMASELFEKVENKERLTILHDLPEPSDLELDRSGETIYWTDRGDTPFGNIPNMISISSPFDVNAEPGESSADQVIVDHLHEPIRLVGDWEKAVMYVDELDGSIWEVELREGGGKRKLLNEGGYFTGIALV